MDKLFKNWKTSAAGLLAILASTPAVIQAISDWSSGKPFAWKQVAGALAISIIGGGLLAAKDSTTHSTLAQMETSTIKQAATDAGTVPPVVIAAPTVIESQAPTTTLPPPEQK